MRVLLLALCFIQLEAVPEESGLSLFEKEFDSLADLNFGKKPPRRHHKPLKLFKAKPISNIGSLTNFPSASINELSTDRTLLQCNGRGVWIDSETLNFDSSCFRRNVSEIESEMVAEAPPFNCAIACRWRLQGWLKDGVFHLNVIDKFIDTFLPEILRKDLKRGFKRCFKRLATYDESQDNEYCEKLSPVISCLRNSYFESCNEHTEDFFTNHFAGTFKKANSYGYCLSEHINWAEDFRIKDAKCKKSETSFTCRQHCTWHSNGLLSRNGRKNATAIDTFVNSSFPASAVSAMTSGIQQCYDLHRPGRFDPANNCLGSKPFFHCIHRNFFEVCRPDDYPIAYPCRY